MFSKFISDYKTFYHKQAEILMNSFAQDNIKFWKLVVVFNLYFAKLASFPFLYFIDVLKNRQTFKKVKNQ